MWSLRRLSSSSLLGSYGGFKCISYMPSRFSAFSPGQFSVSISWVGSFI
uniref:Uncharacterized protein n=1 Tax=Manihot esculenta TaxID=3983 RepID=A0A2C9UQ52_MANES